MGQGREQTWDIIAHSNLFSLTYRLVTLAPLSCIFGLCFSCGCHFGERTNNYHLL
jgi:hypothetical protein